MSSGLYCYQQPFWGTFTYGPQMWFYFLMIHTQTFWCFPWVMMKVLQSSVPKNVDRITHIYTPNSFPMYSEHVCLGERSAPLPRSHQPTSPARERKLLSQYSELHTSMSNYIRISHSMLISRNRVKYPSWKWKKQALIQYVLTNARSVIMIMSVKTITTATC